MDILFVCTGNTCRSPMAAGLMNKIAAENDMDIYAESAGIFAVENDPVSENAVSALLEYGVDISEHTAQPITEDLLIQSDLILTMTEAHKQVLENYAAGKVFTLAEYAGTPYDIPDPYGGDLEEYKETASDIYDALTEIAEKLADKTLRPEKSAEQKNDAK